MIAQVSFRKVRLMLAVLLVSAMFQPLITPLALANDEPVLMLELPLEHEQTGIRTLKAQVLVNAPPRFVWAHLTAYSELNGVLPGYHPGRLTQNGMARFLEVSQKVSPLLPTYHYQVRVDEDPGHMALTLNRTSGDFKALNVTYHLVSRNAGLQTLVTYEVSIDPGLHLPGINGIIRNNTETMLSAFQNYVEAGYQKSLIGQR